jgi:hypothetical protein
MLFSPMSLLVCKKSPILKPLMKPNTSTPMKNMLSGSLSTFMTNIRNFFSSIDGRSFFISCFTVLSVINIISGLVSANPWQVNCGVTQLLLAVALCR